MEKAVIHNRDIIMFGLQPWDIEIGSNFKNMAVEIARHNRVLYVNRPLDRITYWKKRSDRKTKTRLNSIQKGEGILTPVTDTLSVLNPPVILESVNWLPQSRLYRYLNRRNNKKLAKAIQAAATSLQFNNPILIIDNDFFNGLYLKEYLSPSVMVYYIRDYLLSQPYFNKHGQTAEPALITKADLVAANSLYLSRYASQYNQQHFYIGQGCETELFVQHPGACPEDLRQISHPMIGYCGMLTASRLDLRLIEDIATRRPSWQIVLTGPEDDSFKQSVLHRLPNVHFPGIKPATALPGYVHQFDVCINPQQVNPMTIGNYPRKIDEYLAAGKSVVATQTEAMQEFKEYVQLCNGVEEYIHAIEEELNTPATAMRVQQRRAYACSHTWQASVEKLYHAIQTIQS